MKSYLIIMSDVQKPQPAVEAFDAFLAAFKEGKSYVLNEVKEDLFTKDNLDTAYNLYVKNSISEEGSDKKFDEVIKAIQEESSQEIIIDIINHAVWLWSLPNNRKATWIIEKDIYNENLLKINGVAGGGSGYVQKKTNGVRYVLYLLNSLVEETDKCKKTLIDLLIKGEDYDKDKKYPIPDGVKNLLLHLCKPDAYEPIASTDDKKKIVSTFWMNIDTNKRPENKTKAIENLDDTIKEIRQKLHLGNANFYDNSLPLLWKHEKGTELSLVQKLEYKKAMILYGPPGTSKTYTAKELATSVIFRHIMRHDKDTALKIIKNNLLGELKKRIKVLQFHINLNYEDFIAGHTIEGNNVKTKKGVIYDIIEESKKTSMSVSDTKIGFSIDETNETTNDKNAKLPYVVILDEINRTDISRVFGELFSAIENRGEDIDLLLPDPDNQNQCELKLNQKHNLKLNIPENIYFIGTMNEIDFSLERVDFALRRRFIWELHDFDKETLSEIIEYRLGDYADDIFQEDKDDFRDKCVALNKKIEDVMGETYHLGHAFFADIANIYNKLKENGMSDCWNKAKVILWEISIKPTLDAYCGTMDSGLKETYLGNKNSKGKFHTAFFGQTKDNGDKENQ